MAVSEIEVSETLTAVAHAQPRRNSTPDRTADQRAAARANMKKKRAAHRVALRRPHTGG